MKDEVMTAANRMVQEVLTEKATFEPNLKNMSLFGETKALQAE